jgi:septum formation protein
MKIILGSASPRRQQLLKELFHSIEVRAKHVQENYPETLFAENIALFLAEEKTKAFKGEIGKNEILITADTIVWMDDQMLGIPQDKDEALRMLNVLSGRNHQVYTGVCISDSSAQKSFFARSDVWFRAMKESDLIEYIEHYKPFDKAGSYGAQECLPENMNPLSKEEKDFLLSIGKDDLFEKSLAVKDHARVPIIDKIEGSYFNVMGLPLTELYRILKNDFNV